jgi:hypothetical protein
MERECVCPGKNLDVPHHGSLLAPRAGRELRADSIDIHGLHRAALGVLEKVRQALPMRLLHLRRDGAGERLGVGRRLNFLVDLSIEHIEIETIRRGFGRRRAGVMLPCGMARKTNGFARTTGIFADAESGDERLARKDAMFEREPGESGGGGGFNAECFMIQQFK